MRQPFTLPAPPDYDGWNVRGVAAQNMALWRPSQTIYGNAHMWYGVRTGVYVHTQRDNVAVGISDGTMHYSGDNGDTWDRTLAFTDALDTSFCHVFEDGNILWATKAKLYLSTDQLATYGEVTPQGQDGEPYPIHTPANAARPGLYFFTFEVHNSWMVPGVGEMLVWGNYANVVDGATPINVWYSVDSGVTVKAAYTFGQNPYVRDDGTDTGGSTGTLLGDASNILIARHFHSVTYNPIENAFYACTGDTNRAGPVYECHWLRGTYDAAEDAWAWTVLLSGSSATRAKAGGLNFKDGLLYYVSDASNTDERGVYRTAVADITSLASHNRIRPWTLNSGVMMLHGDTIITRAPPYAHDGNILMLVSNDLGATWGEYDIQGLGVRSAIRIHRPNSEGWFRCDLRIGPNGSDPGEVMYFKPRV